MMAQNILIIGLKNKNSGKTSLARAVISYLKEEEFNVSGFKPFSGNNIWYDFDMISEALKQGRIYSKDVQFLKKESDINIGEESLNPIHRIWNEPSIIDPITHLPNFILDRINLQSGSHNEQLVVINQHNRQQLNKRYFKKIVEKSYITQPISDIESLNKLTQKYYHKALVNTYQAIEKKFDFIVIESYADQALLPWNGLHHFDVVLAIEPGHIMMYDPAQYGKALQVSKQVHSWEVSTQRIAELLKPMRRLSLTPKRSDEIISNLKNKVSVILDV
ncbi:MAG: hypothetical protein R6V50_05385 [Thermoplasmatota archaeon]